MARGGGITDEQLGMIMNIIWLIIIIGASGASIYLWMRNEKRQQRIEKALKEHF